MLVWLMVIVAILLMGKFKDEENRSDREQQTVWRQQLKILQVEAQVEFERLGAWLRTLNSQADAKQQIEKELQGGEPFLLKKHGKYQVANWTHPKYGIQVELQFFEKKLVGHGSHTGTVPLPQPSRHSFDSNAESVRKKIPRPAIAAWLAALFVAAVSARYGRVAEEFMLAISLACGTAWLVNPWYSITLLGIFSNDILFFALLMYLASIFLLALRTPKYHMSMRFSLRTLLAITTALAVLMAMGPFGYVMISVFAIGGLLFAVLLLLAASVDQSVARLPMME